MKVFQKVVFFLVREMRERGGSGLADFSAPHHRFKQMVETSFGPTHPLFFFFFSPRPGAIILAVAGSILTKMKDT